MTTLTPADSLRAAVCLTPTDGNAHAALVDCLTESGDGEGALQAAFRWMVACPEDDEARWACARLLGECPERCPECKGTGEIESGVDYMGKNEMMPCPYCEGTVSDGRRELGEFIAVQMELAGMPRCERRHREGMASQCRCRHCELKRTERRLLSERGNAWFGDHVAYAMPGTDLSKAERMFSVPTAVVERGFISRVRIGLDAWCGGECERCENGRDSRGNWILAPENTTGDPCEACHGTGRTEPLGVRLCREWPITGVEISDREPWAPQDRGDIQRAWWFDPSVPGDAPDSCKLPREIMRRLPAEGFNGNNRMAWRARCATSQEAKAAANAALSETCLQWARGRAMREVFGVPRTDH